MDFSLSFECRMLKLVYPWALITCICAPSGQSNKSCAISFGTTHRRGNDAWHNIDKNKYSTNLCQNAAYQELQSDFYNFISLDVCERKQWNLLCSWVSNLMSCWIVLYITKHTTHLQFNMMQQEKTYSKMWTKKAFLQMLCRSSVEMIKENMSVATLPVTHGYTN